MRMPSDEGPKAESRVENGTVLDCRAERDTVTGLPVLGGVEVIGVEVSQASDVLADLLLDAYAFQCR